MSAKPSQRTARAEASALRAEARLIAGAGVLLLAIGLPLTLVLAVLAFAPQGLSPIYPALIGLPFVAAGYAACRYASWRLVLAQRVENEAGLSKPR